MSLNLLEVVAAVRARRASLSAETVGYLLLAVADQVVAVPREVGVEDVFLGEEGALRLGAGTAADSERSERALRDLLDALLGVASTATPALARIGRRASGAGIEGLLRELEAALIPVNRAAARRALNRLYRDAHKAAQSAELDVVAAQAWLKRSPAPSVPAPGVVAVSSSALPLVVHESPVVAFEATPRPSSRPPPLPDQRPAIETLTHPEPVLARAAARARSEPPPLPPEPVVVAIPEPAPAPDAVTPVVNLTAGTPRLGTYVAPVVYSAPSDISEPAFELATDDATDPAPYVATEPPAVTVTAPLPPCDAALDDEIMIVVESELTPVPEEPAPREIEWGARWWSSPDPPAPGEPEAPALEAPLPARLSKTAPMPAVELRAPELPPLDDAALDDAAAAFAGIADVPRSEPGAPGFEAADLVERGWTPAPEPIPPSVPALSEPEPPPEPAPPRFPPRKSDVSELLRGFAVSEARSERDLCRDLKLLAGVDLTPFPGTNTAR